jgi:N-acetylmuramoyl-L-alanine amidase
MRKTAIMLLCSFALAGILVSCEKKEASQYEYHGTIDSSAHTHLAGKKIFIDPGHGAKGNTDGRKGPSGLREEEINLKVGIILAALCRKAGADVKLSRTSDVDLSLADRAKMANEFGADLFICIHHNGNPRPKDKVNYPSILIWGNREENPASYDLSELLLTEFNKSFDKPGIIASDYAVFRETGAQVLRETREQCPAVLGEFGFFTDPDFETFLRDESFNVTEAEHYFTAISEFFKRGNPGATILVNHIVKNPDDPQTFTDRSPRIAIRIDSGINKQGITPGTLRVTLNDLNLPVKKIDEKTYLVEYGQSLYGGGYRLRFSFRNPRYRSSQILTGAFNVPMKKDEYDANIAEGARLIGAGKPREALYRLLPALYAGFTDPKGDLITWNVARAFDHLGDKGTAGYFYATLNQFFPQSALRAKIPSAYLKDRHVPVDFYGKKVKWEKWDYK